MPTVSVLTPNVVECQMHGLAQAKGSNDRVSISVWHFYRQVVGTGFSAVNLENAFQTAICVPVTNALNNRYVQTFNVCRNICDATSLAAQVSRAVAGAIVGDTMAPTDAAFLLFRTGLRGRSYMGKKFLFPMSEADTTGATADLFNAGALANLAAITLAYLTGFTDADGNTWKPCVVSRKLSQLRTNPTVVSYEPIVATAINKRVSDMRTRKVRSVY